MENKDSSCFIKYTGYGNAVGLQLSYGLLGGGKSDEATGYSSDSDSRSMYRASLGEWSDVIGGHVVHYCWSDVIGVHVIHYCLG